MYDLSWSWGQEKKQRIELVLPAFFSDKLMPKVDLEQNLTRQIFLETFLFLNIFFKNIINKRTVLV